MSTPAHRRRQRGMALAVSLFVMSGLLLAATSSLLVAMSGIRATRNYRGASQVHFAAESAVSEALQVINGVGVVQLQSDVVQQWPTLWGTAPHQFAPLGGFTVTVAPVAIDASRGRLVATANGPEGVRNTVVASVIRSDIPASAPGAVYLATDAPTTAVFDGNAFQVDGNDRNYTGGAGPGLPVPGIATRNETNTQATIASLTDQQRDNVLGLGYAAGPPITTSVQTSPAAPSVSQLNQIIADLLARPGVVQSTDKNVSGSITLGTPEAPQITYLSADTGVVIKGNGSISGAGILIVEGNLTIQGKIEFKGLVIARGGTEVKKDPTTGAAGSATLYGSLWTTNVSLVLGGSAVIQYSSQALSVANRAGGGGALPAPLTITALVDCAQVPAGSGGCA